MDVSLSGLEMLSPLLMEIPESRGPSIDWGRDRLPSNCKQTNSNALIST